MTTQTEIDQLAALLDGALGTAEVSPQLASLASLASRVSTTIPVAAPSLAFREALRADLMQSVAANAAGTAASTAASTAGTAGTTASATAATTSFGTQLAAWVAGLTASALLVSTGVVAFAPSAGPGDALYGAKRAIEQGQLAVADPTDRAALLLGLVTERVEEALGLTDELAIERLLDDSQRQLRDALALLDELPLDVSTGLLQSYATDHRAALTALREQNASPALATRLERLLAQTNALLVPGGAVEPGQPGPLTPEPGGNPLAPVPTFPSDEPAAPTDDVTTPVPGPADDATDPVDVPTEGVTDPVDDLLDDLTDPLDDVVGGTGSGVGDLLRP